MENGIGGPETDLFILTYVADRNIFISTTLFIFGGSYISSQDICSRSSCCMVQADQRPLFPVHSMSRSTAYRNPILFPCSYVFVDCSDHLSPSRNFYMFHDLLSCRLSCILSVSICEKARYDVVLVYYPSPSVWIKSREAFASVSWLPCYRSVSWL